MAGALPGERRVELEIMGMPIVVDVRDELEPGVVDRMLAVLRDADRVFSTYREDSDVSRLNRGELELADAHPDVREVLALCDELRVITNGYFDAGRVLDRGVDPSGVVKGWAVDRAGELLEAAGARNYSLNAGGDVRLRGAPLPDSRWRVGIEHPGKRDRLAAVLEANDLAVATSGAYVRGQHVLDPHTGRPPEGVLSVTIAGPELTIADAYATAAFAMGTAGPEWTASLGLYEAMTILADGTTLSTPGFPRVE
ncbi:MAG TPA: FAD:protein FMN transferase [Gaiellaceae bacterium]|nr:FAD:protein FMN transferase [Gaiellaceae bacterium]